MIKRGIGYYVVLALCVLGLVLQPIKIFALNILSSDYSDLVNNLNNIGDGHQFNNITNLSASSAGYGVFSRAVSDCMDLFGESLSLSDGFYSPYALFDGEYYLFALAFLEQISSSTTTYYRGYIYFYNNPPNAVNGVFDGSDMLMGCAYQYNFSTGSYSVYKVADFYNDDVTFINSSIRHYFPIGVFGINGTYYAIENYTNDYITPSIPVPDLPNYPDGTGNTYNPDANSGQVNWPNFIYMIASWFFYNGVMNTNLPGQSQTFNYPGTVGIGAALTYDWLCKVNLGNSTVSYLGNDYPNYLFQLSELMYMIDESIGHFADNIEDLDIGSIGSDIFSIKSDLEAAFPEDEAEINSAIADAIMDPESDNHISAAGIVQSKSDLDEGLSAFEVDTSGSVYSSPFAAISNPDNWLFFSQDTAANLQVQPAEASLQGVDNSSDLLYYNSVNQQVNNMMGWGD